MIVADPGRLEFDSPLGLNPQIVVVFDFPHFGHHVGHVDQFPAGVSTGENEVKSGRLAAYEALKILKLYDVKIDRHIDFVQDDEVVGAFIHGGREGLQALAGPVDVHGFASPAFKKNTSTELPDIDR